MRGCLRGCLGSVGLAVVVTAVAWAGWRWGDVVFPTLERWVGAVGETRGVSEAPEGPVPSPALAEATLDRVDALRQGEGGDTLALGAAEVSSVIRYALPGIIPPGVDEPAVTMRDGDVVLSARVAVAAFPELPDVDEVVALLPDTVRIELTGRVEPWTTGYAALRVERVEASRIPLPGRMIPGILTALGRRPMEGLPEDAFPVPLPPGLASAAVDGERLILVADR